MTARQPRLYLRLYLAFLGVMVAVFALSLGASFLFGRGGLGIFRQGPRFAEHLARMLPPSHDTEGMARTVLQMHDEQLAGRGLDLYALRTYNSPGAPDDGDGDGWRWGYEQTVRFQGPGSPPQPHAGATVIRTDGDGHETA